MAGLDWDEELAEIEKAPEAQVAEDLDTFITSLNHQGSD